MKTHAKRRGTDWVLNGSKMWVTNGAIADLAVVWAMTDEGTETIHQLTIGRELTGLNAF